MRPDPSHRSDSSAQTSTSRPPWLRRVAALSGATILLVGAALIACGLADKEQPPETHPASAPGSPPIEDQTQKASATGHTGQGGTEQAEEKPPRFARTLCWEELERFNDTVTLDTFRDWAAPLMAVKDPLVLEYLKGRLSELIGNDEGRAMEVLEWAREASPAEFKLLMAGLRGSQALVLPKVAAQLTSLGLDERMDLGRRAGFLDELQRMPKLEPAALERLTQFAKDPASGEAGWVTTRAIGRVMKEDFSRTGNARPYLDKLFAIATETPDEPVRYLALEMGMHADAPMDAEATERLAKILATEGSEEVRQVAAHDLSLAQDKPRALQIYAQAFAAEKDLCVRWALFRFAARAAGKDALPVMADMATADPRFQGDYHDFARLYASGVVDFDRIWFGLPSQDPHGCLDRHE